jgi:shikimate kinase
MNIYLIGYRCTGKSSAGKLLAGRLGMKFTDTDEEIVKRAKKPISVIVEASGWGGFRRIEKEIIRDISKVDRQVVAAGGGTILDDDNVDIMKKTGIVIWLRAESGTIKGRIAKDGKTDEYRPALTAKGTIEEIGDILETRRSFYERAMDHFIDTDYRDVNDICVQIADLIKPLKEKE